MSDAYERSAIIKLYNAQFTHCVVIIYTALSTVNKIQSQTSQILSVNTNTQNSVTYFSILSYISYVCGFISPCTEADKSNGINPTFTQKQKIYLIQQIVSA